MCFYNDGDSPSFFDERVVVARKEHRCCECRESIAPGDTYERITGKWDEVETFKTCARCYFVRQAIVAYEIDVEGCQEDESTPPFGGLRPALASHGANYGLGTAVLCEVPRW